MPPFVLFLVFVLSLFLNPTEGLLLPTILKKNKIASNILKKKIILQKKKKRRNNALAGASISLGGFGIAVAANLFQQRRQNIINDKYNIYQPEVNSLTGQTIVITGGSSGLGLESAKRLAFGGANIIITTRTDEKGQAAIQQIQSYLQQKREDKNREPPRNQRIDYKVLNLDDLQSMKDTFISDWDDVAVVDILLNNAGILAIPNRELTIDGYERQIQSNHLGHFLLTSLLSSKLSQKARILNVSSTAHQLAFTGLKFDYLWTAEEGYGPLRSYGQSKLANIYFTRELQRRIDEIPTLGWTATALHPGGVLTNISRYLINNNDNEAMPSTTVKHNDDNNKDKLANFAIDVANTINPDFKSVEQGASTQVWLASGADDFEDVAGKYYDRCKEQTLEPFALKEEDGIKLWKESEEKAGCIFELPMVGKAIAEETDDKYATMKEAATTEIIEVDDDEKNDETENDDDGS